MLGPTPLGYNVMVNGEREGLVYHSEVFDDEPLTPGAQLEAWVLKVRADGKIDVSLRQPAVQQVWLAACVLPAACCVLPAGTPPVALTHVPC